MAIRQALRIFGTYLIAALAVYGLAVMASTQSVLADLIQTGVEVSPGDRLLATGRDLVAFLPVYGSLIAAAMAIAFPVAAGLARFVPGWRAFALVTGGALGMILLHQFLKEASYGTLLTATTSATGLLAQCIAGGVGGYFYYMMRKT